MPQQTNNRPEPVPSIAAPEKTAAILRQLAGRVEQAGFGQQADFIAAAMETVSEAYDCLFPGVLADCRVRVLDLARSGAPESAVLALMPPNSAFTAGRMHNGAIIAQVVLEAGNGDHSREARWLAMAWLAALLRAVAGLVDAPPPGKLR